jgi:hypothetical protein
METFSVMSCQNLAAKPPESVTAALCDCGKQKQLSARAEWLEALWSNLCREIQTPVLKGRAQGRET